jgi:hypothetical protein
MNTLLLIVSVILLLLSGLFAWLLLRLRREHTQSRLEQQALAARLQAQEDDIAALYTAGVNMDKLLLEQGRRLRECLERIDSLQVQETSHQPYHAAIERIRKGADAQELVSEFGMSQSEANLLARLHGAAR